MIKTNHDDLDELYEELSSIHPKLAEKAFEHWGKNMYKQAMCYLLEIKYGKHINEHSMDNALKVLSEYLDVELPLWSIDDLKTLLRNMGYTIVGDHIEDKEYTIYDINYIAQKEKIIHKSLGSDPKKFIMLAIESLDIDSEYAYDGYKRILENEGAN